MLPASNLPSGGYLLMIVHYRCLMAMIYCTCSWIIVVYCTPLHTHKIWWTVPIIKGVSAILAASSNVDAGSVNCLLSLELEVPQAFGRTHIFSSVFLCLIRLSVWVDCVVTIKARYLNHCCSMPLERCITRIWDCPPLPRQVGILVTPLSMGLSSTTDLQPCASLILGHLRSHKEQIYSKNMLTCA
jgi:hypothetical protein